ncbi:MAG: hypothetical protein ACK5FC_05450 [Bacteroidota bacterium]
MKQQKYMYAAKNTFLVQQQFFHSLTLRGLEKKRIAKRNLSFKKAVCALKNVHFNTQCRFFCKGVVMGCGYFKPL